ncbi:MAG TPA: Ig-like domain-containing protein [Micromonosporaceae bacterium]|jgi:hypothetical protein
MNHLIVAGRVTTTDPDAEVRASLCTDVDPAAPLVAGTDIELSLSVAPDPAAPWGYGYLMASSLGDVATIVGASGAEYFPAKQMYRVRAEAGERRTGRIVLRIRDTHSVAALRPVIAVGAPDGEERHLVRTGSLSDVVFRVGDERAPGLAIIAAPGRSASAIAAGVVVGVTEPRHGSAEAREEVVTYTPVPGFTGYDRFGYELQIADGTLSGTVIAYVGTDVPPGLLDGHSAVARTPWKAGEISGPLPWLAP